MTTGPISEIDTHSGKGSIRRQRMKFNDYASEVEGRRSYTEEEGEANCRIREQVR